MRKGHSLRTPTAAHRALTRITDKWMCTGLAGLQLLFDVAVHHSEAGQDLPEDLPVCRSRQSPAVSWRSCERSAIIEFDLMKVMPNLGYCLPEDNAREFGFRCWEKTPGEFL